MALALPKLILYSQSYPTSPSLSRTMAPSLPARWQCEWLCWSWRGSASATSTRLRLIVRCNCFIVFNTFVPALVLAHVLVVSFVFKLSCRGSWLTCSARKVYKASFGAGSEHMLSKALPKDGVGCMGTNAVFHWMADVLCSVFFCFFSTADSSLLCPPLRPISSSGPSVPSIQIVCCAE